MRSAPVSFMARLAAGLAAVGMATAQTPLQLTIRPDSVVQTLDNFGTSAAFELNEITDAWSEPNLDTLAMLLFDTTFKADGSPRGIGLSGFRVEIGACSHDNGDTSGIERETALSHCPLRPNGTYDWSRMNAETWWVRKAHAYKVGTVQAYSNSPPIHHTRNGLACRTHGQPGSNLRPDAYGLFADYLARIAAHYDSLGAPLKYISPVNEPQWDWNCATNQQEGSQWTTAEISRLADSVSAAFVRRSVSTRILLTEAGQLDFVYRLTSPNNDNNPSVNQLRLWAPGNPLYVGDRPKVAPILAAHSYWTDNADSNLLNIRARLARAIRDTNPNLRYWQSEYSFLGNGYRDLSGGQNPTRHELGLTLAKVIHADLTIGDAIAWQWWETFESTTGLPRYRLVRVDRDAQTAVPEKTYWALGHYSRFIRPGMRRLRVQRSDSLTALQRLRDVMPTVFHDPRTGDIAVVLLNYRADAREVKLSLEGVGDSALMVPYLSTDSLSMARRPAIPLGDAFTLPARSITTLVLKTGLVVALRPENRARDRADEMRVEVRKAGGSWSLRFPDHVPPQARFTIRDAAGKTVLRGAWNGRTIPLRLPTGVYSLTLDPAKASGREAMRAVPLVLL